MSHFDVFNGDADGLCALHQLRLAEPCAGTLVTGVKRDVALLAAVPREQARSVTVLDISLDQNREALHGLLRAGCVVAYFDHHFAGAIPEHARLRAHIDTAPDVCTSVLVDRYLGGRQRLWAVVGAFGDNLDGAAHRLADLIGLDAGQRDALRNLGRALNYNAYGETVTDLVLPPDALYLRLRPHTSPFEFLVRDDIWRVIAESRDNDLAQARAQLPCAQSAGGRIYRLPHAAWSRRVQGVWGNDLAREAPALAHAIAVEDGKGGLVVSVRAPLLCARGADQLCRRFATGGGRTGAAGINRLELRDLDDFVRAFSSAWPQAAAGDVAQSA